MATDVDRGMVAGEWGRHGWSLVLRGIVAVIFGVMALVWPGISLAVLVVLFGIFAIVDGILSIAAAIVTPEGRRRWWALVGVGIIGIAAGIITFVYPGITMIALVAIIAAWALITGILEITVAIRGPSIIGHRWLWGLSGVLSIVFAVLLFLFPIAGIVAVDWQIAFYAIMFGITLISLGMQVSARIEPGLRVTMQH